MTWDYQQKHLHFFNSAFRSIIDKVFITDGAISESSTQERAYVAQQNKIMDHAQEFRQVKEFITENGVYAVEPYMDKFLRLIALTIKPCHNIVTSTDADLIKTQLKIHYQLILTQILKIFVVTILF
jgi:hypothetical protein